MIDDEKFIGNGILEIHSMHICTTYNAQILKVQTFAVQSPHFPRFCLQYYFFFSMVMAGLNCCKNSLSNTIIRSGFFEVMLSIFRNFSYVYTQYLLHVQCMHFCLCECVMIVSVYKCLYVCMFCVCKMCTHVQHMRKSRCKVCSAFNDNAHDFNLHINKHKSLHLEIL